MGLPRGLYRALGDGWAGPALRVVSHPIPAIALFVSAMAWTHWPPVVDTLMVTQSGSFLLDLVWLASGVIFWWPVVAPVPQREWLQEPARVGYLIVATLVNTGVFAYLTFSPLPLYATYELAPPVSGLSTRDDQLLAGLLMKMGGAVVLWTAISILFYRWYRRSEGVQTGRSGAAAAVLLALVLAGCADAPEMGNSAEWASAGPVQIAGAVVGEPPVADRAALYMRIRNPGEEALHIIGVEVPGAQAELHRTEVVEGVMRMARVESLVLAPGAEAVLRPGGLHIMLTGLERRLVAGETLTVRLLLEEVPVGVALTATVVPLDQLESGADDRM